MRIRDHKRRVYSHYSDRYRPRSGWMSAEDRAWENLAPMGREVGSPDFERLSILDMYSWGNITDQQAMGELGVDHQGLAAVLEAEGMEATEETREAHRRVIENLLTPHKTGDVEVLKGMFGATARTVSIEAMNPLHRKP